MSPYPITRNLSLEATHFLLYPPHHHHRIENTLRTLHTFPWCGRDLKPGDTVEIGTELYRTLEQRKGKFFLIHWILQDRLHGTIRFRGLTFERASLQPDEKVLLPKQANEVILNLKVNACDTRAPFEQNLVDIDIDDIVTSREVRFTNALFPTHSFRDRFPYRGSDHNLRIRVWLDEVLVCRWLTVSYYKDAAAMRADRLCQLVVRRFEEQEVPDTFLVSDAALRFEHCGDPIYKVNDKFTMVDLFSGGGGMSCRAVQAGFHVKYAVDMDKNAMATYSLNNPSTETYVEEIGDFYKRLVTHSHPNKWRCHHLHASPSCKFIAWCHTRPGQHDEANQNTMIVMHALLSAIRPMTASLEESDNLKNHKDWYRIILTDFLDNGYSIAWRISDARGHDSSSKRSRFLLNAACPGIPLSSFAIATRGPPGSGLPPYRTIGDTLAELRRHPRATHNDPAKATPRNRQPYDPYTTACPTITTHGAGGSQGPVGSYHPSGTRDFTIREYATLQKLPLNYNFGPEGRNNKTKLLEQIGNMVSPPQAKAMLEPVLELHRRIERESARQG